MLANQIPANGASAQECFGSTLTVEREPKELRSVDMIIIKSTTNQVVNEAGYINGNETTSPAHVLIDRDGLVTQFIPFNKQTGHHLGGSWEGIKDLTSRSIIMVFENHGRLEKQADHFISNQGVKIETTDVFTGIHQNEESLSYWQKFTENQVLIAEKIIRCLTSAYQVKYILGYEEVCPGLQTDPGPAFPLEIMRRKIMKEDIKEQPEDFNIRNIARQVDLSAIVGDEQVDDEERKEAKIVNIRRKSGGWYKVNIDLGGFIKEEWISI